MEFTLDDYRTFNGRKWGDKIEISSLEELKEIYENITNSGYKVQISFGYKNFITIDNDYDDNDNDDDDDDDDY